MSDSAPIPPTSARKKRERPFLGYSVQKGQIRYLSAKALLQFDDRHSGCPRKWAFPYVFGKKLPRIEAFDEGVSLAEIAETYLTTGKMVLTPVLQPAKKFFPEPGPDILCEEPIGSSIEAAVSLRDRILRSPNAPNRAAAEAELARLAGLVTRGIPVDGAADWIHRRGTYKDKEGVLRTEAPGLVVISNGDLKSISQINTHITPSFTKQGWAQTDIEVCEDPQMVAYAKAYLGKFAEATHVRSEKVYAQKKPHAADIRGGLSSRQQVDDRWGELEERVVDELVQTAGAQKIEDVRPAMKSCDSYTHLVGCGFLGCGVDCLPGKVKKEEGEVPCPNCKGKGKTQKGCGYRYVCPLSSETIQIPLVTLDLARGQIGETGMSLFDRVPTTSSTSSSSDTSVVPVPPVPPARPTAALSYEAQVAAAQAKFEAELSKTPTSSSIDKQSELPIPSTIGERISVALCSPGDDYMVDWDDGNPPRRMTLKEVFKGKFKFWGAQGDKVELGVEEFVFRLPPGVSSSPPVPPTPRASCGATGCGVGCAPGYVVSDGGPSCVYCPSCAGKGAVSTQTMAVKPPDAPKAAWVDQQSPLSDEEIARLKADPTTDPELLRLAIEHKRIAEEKARAEAAADPKAASRGGNCLGSGQVVKFSEQPSVVDGKVVCSMCGAERAIPKEIRKARPMPTEMPFPGHRRPKGEEKSSTPESSTPVVPTPPSTPPEPVVDRSCSQEEIPVPPLSDAARAADALGHARKMEPADKALATKAQEEIPVPPGTVATVKAVVTVDGILLTLTEAAILTALFRDRAMSIPKAALSAEAVGLLQRLKLVD